MIDEASPAAPATPAGGARPALRSRLPAARRRLTALASDPSVRLGVTVAVVMRIVLGVAAWLSAELAPIDTVAGNHLEQLTPQDSALWPVVGPWERWDALWFLHVARDGYPVGGSEAGFAPLYPLTARVLSPALGGTTLAALLVSTVALAVALVLLHRLVSADLGVRVAGRSVVITALFPGAFFLLAPYSESLFLAFAVGALLAARRRHFTAAGCAAGLAVLCRQQGILLLLPLAVEAVRALRDRAGPGGEEGAPRATPASALPALVLPVLAAGGWFLYCRIRLGLPMGPLTAENVRWGRHPVAPWRVLADSIGVVRSWSRHEEIEDLLAVGLLGASMPLLVRRLPLSYTVLAAGALIVMLCGEAQHSPLMSALRYTAVVFPLFVALATVRLPRALELGVAAVSAAAMLFLLHEYVHFVFVA